MQENQMCINDVCFTPRETVIDILSVLGIGLVIFSIVDALSKPKPKRIKPKKP